MQRRHKFYKILIVTVLYIGVYFLVSYLLTPAAVYKFVSEELRAGNAYVLMYLVGKTPPFSDAAGADVFALRRCGRCFITNNKGFLPLTEYDAIVVLQDSQTTAAFMEPGKRYIMEADRQCLENKLVNCNREPVLTALGTQERYDLCGLCKHLTEKRQDGDR